jgi:hypothetical protein
LVEDGAKGVADRWLGDPVQAAQDGAKMRSAVKRFSGKPAEQASEPAPDSPARSRKRSTRAEQAATGMMGPPPSTFDEKVVKDWLAKMSAEDLAKLARLTAIAKQGKKEEHGAWRKVDRGMAQNGLHVEVHGGTVNINNSPQGSRGFQADSQVPRKSQDLLGRHLSRLRDFING